MDAIKELNFLSPHQILTKPEDLLNYGRDWTRYYTPNPLAILMPTSTLEVKKIIDWARKNKIGLVPSGGRTGLSGAAVAKNKEVVLSLEKMNKIIKLDETNMVLTCESGCLTEEIQNYASEHNLYFPVDFAARGSSQIGGNVATNVGGLNVIRYGLMRDWVSSLEVVTGSGEILNLNNDLVKNASGYDLRHLMIGSEGTLGVITKVGLKLTHPPKETSVLIMGLNNSSNVSEVFKIFRSKTILTAFEFFTHDAMEYVLEHHKELSLPLQNKCSMYILAEIESSTDSEKENILSSFESALENEYISDGVVSQSEQQAENFWKYRDFISESLAPHTPYKNDLSVKLSDITEFIKSSEEILSKEYPDYKVVWFGHIGDGNLHVNILKPKNIDMETFVKNCQKVDLLLFQKIKEFSGSISAEHGVGLSKKPFLHFTRSPYEIEIMRNIKKVFDPDGILNPGKIFD